MCLRVVVPEQYQAQACVKDSSYQKKTSYRPVSKFRRTRTKPGKGLSTLHRTRTKPGTGLCQRFVIPEQNQAQVCVYASSYQNKTRHTPVSKIRHTRTSYRPVSKFRRTRTHDKTVKYKQLSAPFLTWTNPVFIATAIYVVQTSGTRRVA
jgi:hypothetical protein